MIELNNISFSYNSSKEIIRDFNGVFEEGDIYFLLGENGSGKTTLIRLLLGFLNPNEGNIVSSREYTYSYLPDNNGLYGDLSVKDNVKFRLSLYDQSFKEKEELFFHDLKLCNMSEYADVRINRLSLGTKKKAAILCSLLVDADVYVLDEPTSNIDQESREAIVDILNRFDLENKIVIIVTHDPFLISNVEGKRIYLEKDKNNEETADSYR